MCRRMNRAIARRLGGRHRPRAGAAPPAPGAAEPMCGRSCGPRAGGGGRAALGRTWAPRREGGSAGPRSAASAAGGAGGGAAEGARSGSARAEGERARRGEGETCSADAARHRRRGAPRPTEAVRRSSRWWRWRDSLLRSRQRNGHWLTEPREVGARRREPRPNERAGAWVGAAAQGAAKLRPASSARRTRAEVEPGGAPPALRPRRGGSCGRDAVADDDARGE